MKPSPISVGLLLLSLGTSLLACGGGVKGDGGDSKSSVENPPPVNTRFVLRIDGKAIDLKSPSGTRFVDTKNALTFITISAEQDPGLGDDIRGASVLLNEPFTTGTFDCTPNERGEVVNKHASVTPGDFFGFEATLTDCLVTVQYIANDRVVGTFSVSAHAPEASSLSGTISKAEGEFDVAVKDSKL